MPTKIEGLSSGRASPMPLQDSLSARRIELARVERAAAALSSLELEVLALSAGHRMRNDEIAARLGIRERRAERILAKALRKFDRGMKDFGR